ncbi:MAG: carbohydrate-binding domain-containing protein [Candidatus Aceula meridiana]|nr:carbohydrate-binding domain-containing protein [Candidatus Aceula meridiana]
MTKNLSSISLKPLIVVLLCITLFFIAYYIKGRLDIDLLPTRHFLIFKEDFQEKHFIGQKERFFESKKEKEERNALFKKILAEAAKGKNIGWIGKARQGDHEYQNGTMYWKGSVHTAVLLPRGEAIIMLEAKGSKAKNIFPKVIIELDNKEIENLFIRSEEWKTYPLKVKTDGGMKILSVTFVNDSNDDGPGQDRNLFLKKIKISKPSLN